MPELPELEATRQNLERWTARAGPLLGVDVIDAKLAVDPELLVGRRFIAWRRRGKQLRLELARPRARAADATLFLHLGMTGKVVRLAPDDSERLYKRMVLRFADRQLAFVDPRRFGDAHTVAGPSAAADDDRAWQGLGPDALLEPLDAAALARAMGRGKTPLKSRLLEQQRVAGLGNIAVIEACFRARAHPHTPVDAVPAAAWKALVTGIREHLEATLATTVGHDEIEYLSEGAASEFLVYGKEGLPCPRCRTPIARDVLAGRPTFTCPRCQPYPSEAR
ncbi:MAG: DNA-formamidopyrimidine glycosylase family protein [Myxococcota bacterium]